MGWRSAMHAQITRLHYARLASPRRDQHLRLQMVRDIHTSPLPRLLCSQVQLQHLMVDGGMTVNELLMQTQADLIQVLTY
jgi:glycerol kinase